MKEHFTITYPNSFNFPNLKNSIIALIASLIIIHFSNFGYNSIVTYLALALLFVIFFVILKSISSENLSNELPSTLYPSLPHTGLDGISLNSYVAGMDTNQYIV